MNRKLRLLALGAALAAAPALLAQSRGAACCALLLAQQPPAPAPNAPPQPSQKPPQQQPAPPRTAEPDAGAPLSKLGLSDDQMKQIHTFRQQAQEQVQAARKDASLTPQQQTQQIREIRHKAHQQVEGVLTPEQREKYDAWRRAHQRRRHGPPPAKQDGT